MNQKRAMERSSAPNVFEAFKELVYSFGPKDLAPLLGCKVGTLYNKADADEGSHAQPTLRDVVLLTQITGDMRVLDALNEMFGRAAYDCVKHQEASDEALLELLAGLGKESGEFHAALAAGLKQRRFTLETMRTIRGEAFDVVAALMTLLARLEGYVDADEHAPR